MTRRRFLKQAFCSGVALIAPGPLVGPAAAGASDRPILMLHRMTTAETLVVIHRPSSDYDTAVLAEVNHLMRDLRTGAVKRIDVRLIDYLFAVQSRLKAKGTFQVVSGYRTPETNARLRRRGKGAVRNSYHIKGKAVDLYMPGVATDLLRKAALEARFGGVGYYPERGFVHLDVGPVRQWSTA